MNKIITILAVVVIMNSCISNKQNEVIVHATILEKLNPTSLKVNKGIFYSIKIELSNNTDTVFKFWTMSCSWESNWLIEDKRFNFCRL